jgi:hypothetical protein
VLFDLIDESPTMELDGVDKARFSDVVDQCYLCDLCYQTKCPYVPPHEWNARLPAPDAARQGGPKFKQEGATLRDKVLTATTTVGALASIPVIDADGQRAEQGRPGAQGHGGRARRPPRAPRCRSTTANHLHASA